MREGRLLRGHCVYELGVYGVFVGGSNGVILNEPVGHLLRTKLSSSNEGGVAAGFAVLSSPYLIGAVSADDEALLSKGYAASQRRAQFRRRLFWVGTGATALIAVAVGVVVAGHGRRPSIPRRR